MQPNVWISDELRLPFFWRDTGPILAWPAPLPTPGQQVPLGYRDPPFAVTPEQINARNEARQRESERVIAGYRERDRERQERELREGREAFAREVSERNRRHGWPY